MTDENIITEPTAINVPLEDVKAVADNTTEITYHIVFDIQIVKHALGFSLPKCIVSIKAGSDMKKYLRQLRTKLI